MKAHPALFKGRGEGVSHKKGHYYSSLQLTYTFKTRTKHTKRRRLALCAFILKIAVELPGTAHLCEISWDCCIGGFHSSKQCDISYGSVFQSISSRCIPGAVRDLHDSHGDAVGAAGNGIRTVLQSESDRRLENIAVIPR